MIRETKALDLTIIGAGMIVHDLILPAAYELQRQGCVNEITICDMRVNSLRSLLENRELNEAFPGQSFTPCPKISDGDSSDPAVYKKVLEKAKPYQAVIVALPDQLHYRVVRDVLDYRQHVLCVKPLVLKYEQSLELEKKAYENGCFVGVEYHKRFDRRSLLAKKHYQQGDLGEFAMGEAKMIEPYYYRSSNFQNWFTCEATDPFVYVGCHYVDLVCFITGLRPVEVSVSGVKGKFPNGKEGFMWANGRVKFENGALLSVTDGLGYPDDGGGSNDQCLNMYFEGEGKGGSLSHDDQFRGVEYGFVKNNPKAFQYVNPDFYRLVPWEGEGLKPVGYGYDSIAATISSASRIEAEVEKSPDKALEIRRQAIEEANEKGLIATPANSAYNELVQEAARMSILRGGDLVEIKYEPEIEVKYKN
jgi:predicted dehydrogenase